MSKDSIKGFLVIAAMAVAAWWIATIPAVKALSFSSLIIGILLGMVYANTLRSRQPKAWDGGVKFCSKRMLRLGIILYGFRLTFQDVVAVGVEALVIDCIIVTCTLLLGVWVGRKMGIERETAIMASTGSAICGAAAVLGAEPIAKGKPHQTAIAVSTVVIFGTLSMFLYPIMYRMGLSELLNPQQMAVYTGSTLHEVAHVVGAGNAMTTPDTPDIGSISLITKMVRVMLLVPVLLAMSWLLNRSNGTDGEQRAKINVPWFAFIFLLMIGVNSGLHAAFDGQEWLTSGLKIVEIISTFMLTLAMTALGSDTSVDKFKQAGAKPFYLAGVLYVWLVVGGFILAKLIV